MIIRIYRDIDKALSDAPTNYFSMVKHLPERIKNKYIDKKKLIN